MREQIFLNKEHQALFDRDGYIVLPMVSNDQLKQLDSLFDEMYQQVNYSGFVSTSYSPNKEFKKFFSDKIVEVLTPSYQNIFIDFQPFGGSFLFKTPGLNSALPLHQDWTILDEEKYYAINCWVPISKITPENGPLHILPGSHFDNFKTLRAPTIPFFFQNDEEIVKESLVSILPAPGEAVILNQSLIHYSSTNKTNEVRKALTAGVKSKGAPMLFHYYNRQEEKLEQYLMDEDFLISFDDFYQDIQERPKGKLLKEWQANDKLILDSTGVANALKIFKKNSRISGKRSNFFKQLVSKFT